MSMNTIKSYIKQNIPALISSVRYLKEQRWCFDPMESKFTRVYHKNRKRGLESVSGGGSTLLQTKVIRNELPFLINQFGVKSFLDIPCGDFNWMNEVGLDVDTYIGADIVRELISLNSQRFGSDKRKFMRLDITKDNLPKVDMIFCRDCLVHFAYADIFLALENFKNSKSKYLLTTTFTSREKNTDIFPGQWRPLNLQQPPFRFPEPIRIINENCSGKGVFDKSLGLWLISNI